MVRFEIWNTKITENTGIKLRKWNNYPIHKQWAKILKCGERM